MISKTNIGDVFSKLTVIEEPFIKRQGNTSRYFAKVQCTCGTIKTVSCSKLRTNNYTQCNDCSFKQRSEKAAVISQYDQMFKRMITNRCKKHNIIIDITVKDYENFTKQPCYYCGDEPKLTNVFSTRKYVNTHLLHVNGIDRLDPSKGYILENCVPCCTSCNYAKHVLTKDEFIKKIEKIYKNHFMEKKKGDDYQHS